MPPRLLALTLAVLGVTACSRPGARAMEAGNTAARDGDLDTAVLQWTSASAAEPGWTEPHLALAHAARTRGDDTAARRHLDLALSANPSSAPAALLLAELALDHAEDPASISMPTAPGSHLIRARLALAQGNHQQALESLRLAGESPFATWLSGCAHLGLAQFEKAQVAFQRTSEQLPSSPLGPYGMARLAARRREGQAALTALREARTRAGAGWRAAAVQRDPAFAFLMSDPAFIGLTSP